MTEYEIIYNIIVRENEHRNLIDVLNKCDLVPIWVVRSYI